MSYIEKNKAFFTNNYVRTAGLSAIYHFGFSTFTYFFFILIVSNILKPMLKDGMLGSIRIFIGCMSLGLFVWTQILIANAYHKNHQKKKRYLDMTTGGRSNDPTVKKQLHKMMLLECLATLVPLMILALPSAIFYDLYGYAFGYALFFENMSIAWVGVYQLFGNAWIGLGVMLVIEFSVALIGRLMSHHQYEINRIEH